MKKAQAIAALTAASSVILLAAAPVFATSVVVSGNGADSDNQANVSVSQSTLISQTNQANINNSVNAQANTGDNSANKNTGGDTSIKTGDSSTAVNLNNNANSNKTSAGCCSSDPVSAAVSISGNGADSNNRVNFTFNNVTGVTSENTLNINNRVNASANTGGNEANKNTGGDTSIETGDANVSVTIGNSGNSNIASVCSCLVAAIVNPPTTPASLVPGVPAVLGAKSLPMTGFDYPFGLIISATLGLVGFGLLLRTKASEVEKLLTSLAGEPKLRI